MHCRKETCSTWFDVFVSGVHSCHSLGKCQASTPDQKLEVPERDNMLHQFCLHHAHPFVAASEKSTCLMQRSKAFGQVIVVSKMFWNIVIVLSVVLWDCCKPTNACRDWAFSNSGLEVGLPAFQLPMFAKCDALPKGDLLDMFVSGVHSCHSFGKCQASTPYQKLKVAESGSTLHQLCIMLVLCLQKIPSLCWRFRICVSIELLATVGGKCGFQPFSCPCSQNVTLPKRGFLDILV